jgi:hypothetical protein
MIAEGQNTYILEPKEEEKFYPSKVRKIIEEIFQEKLRTHNYDPNVTPVLSEDVVKLIRARIRTELKMPRYKVAVQVVIGELKGQGVKVASKCLWDPTFDNFANYSYTNEKVYAVGIVFGTYYE